jgi:hypothetical protein
VQVVVVALGEEAEVLAGLAVSLLQELWVELVVLAAAAVEAEELDQALELDLEVAVAVVVGLI